MVYRSLNWLWIFCFVFVLEYNSQIYQHFVVFFFLGTDPQVSGPQVRIRKCQAKIHFAIWKKRKGKLRAKKCKNEFGINSSNLGGKNAHKQNYCIISFLTRFFCHLSSISFYFLGYFPSDSCLIPRLFSPRFSPPSPCCFFLDFFPIFPADPSKKCKNEFLKTPDCFAKPKIVYFTPILHPASRCTTSPPATTKLPFKLCPPALSTNRQ